MDLMEDEELFLPRRWNGIDFSVSLGKLFRYYIEKIGKSGVKKEEEEKIERICFLILKSVEMALKPQDFTGKGNRLIPQGSLTEEVRSHYLLWYPVIAACSFIRVHREESFTVEYIVPQLLMQWVRHRMTGSGLIGLRYFSCVSVRASQMGFNYIFPASGKMISLEKPYCPVLTHFFDMTDPVFLQEYETLGECEKDLISHRRPHPVIFK